MPQLTPRSFLFAATATLATLNGPLASAQSTQAQIVKVLIDQGFAVRKVKKTWLGRVRIEATGGGLVREVVFNPSTGEILRDFWEEERKQDDRSVFLANPHAQQSSAGTTSVNEASDDNHDDPETNQDEDPDTTEEHEEDPEDDEEEEDNHEDEEESDPDENDEDEDEERKEREDD